MEGIFYLASMTLGGGFLGYLYYRLVGCRSGSCPITSSPWLSIIFGAFFAFTLVYQR